MFFAANIYGSERLSAIYHTLAIPAEKRLKTTAKYLGVTTPTLSRWLSGKANPPRAVVYALWHESHVGRAVTAAHSHEGMLICKRLADSQKIIIEQQRKTIERLNCELESAKRANPAQHAMNEPFYRRN